MLPLKVLILNWTGDRSNWGCQATSHGLERDIVRAAGTDLKLEIKKIPLGEMTTADRQVRALFSRFITRYLLSDQPTERQKRLFRRLVSHSYGAAVEAVSAADVVFFMAEGTMKGDHFLRGLRLLMLPQLAHDLGKPVLSLNQTLFATVPSFLPVIQKVYHRFEMVAVREPASLEYARNLGLNETLLIPDSAFAAEPSGKSLAVLMDQAPEKPFLCVTGSASFSNDTLAGPWRATLQFAKERDLQVCGLFWHRDPMTGLRKVHAEVGGNPLLQVREGIDYQDVSEILSKALGYVGGRYHTAIQSAAVHTPFVAVPAESHKMQGLVEMLRYPVGIRDFLDEDGIRADLSKMLENREELRRSLKHGVDEVLSLRSDGIHLIGRLMRANNRSELRQTVENSPEAFALRNFVPGGHPTPSESQTR